MRELDLGVRGGDRAQDRDERALELERHCVHLGGIGLRASNLGERLCEGRVGPRRGVPRSVGAGGDRRVAKRGRCDDRLRDGRGRRPGRVERRRGGDAVPGEREGRALRRARRLQHARVARVEHAERELARR